MDHSFVLNMTNEWSADYPYSASNMEKTPTGKDADAIVPSFVVIAVPSHPPHADRLGSPRQLSLSPSTSVISLTEGHSNVTVLHPESSHVFALPTTHSFCWVLQKNLFGYGRGRSTDFDEVAIEQVNIFKKVNNDVKKNHLIILSVAT